MQLHEKFQRISESNFGDTPAFASDAERWDSFATAIDEIHREAKARVGQEDLEYIERVDAFSRGAEFVGRALLLLGPGPVSFMTGVGFLWLYKQLQTTEIGHTALHGAFNRIEGAERFHARNFEWKAPIDERSWIRGHNGMHHGLTNVEGSDPDVDFGHARLTEQTPHRFIHYFQVPLTLLSAPVFSVAMNAHFTGMIDYYVRKPDEPKHFIDDDSPESGRRAWHRFSRKARPYYAKELGLYPLLAGPRFVRVLAGNLASEAMRDVYTAATIYCGHVGEDVASFPAGTRPRSRGERYAMQVEAANDFDVPRPLSMLCGALDLQIEHHLFPTLPTNRLREVAGDVRRVCEAHGVKYRSDTWPRTLKRAVSHLWRLSFPGKKERVANEAHSAAS